MNKIRLCTWNVRGIHGPIKRRKIFTCLKKDGVDIAMLQETHLNDLEHMKLQHGLFDQVFFSSFTTSSRGVALLIKKKLPLKILDCIKDQKGRYIIIKGVLQGQNIVLMNVYFPPAHPCTFFTKLFLDLAPLLPNSMVVIGGDFNLIFNPLIDKFPHSTMAPSSHANSLRTLCDEFGLVDVWRSVHPSDKQYTFFSSRHKCHTRIDYFFIPQTDFYSVLSCEISSIIISDHARVIMDINPKSSLQQSRHWRLNTVILKDENFVNYFSGEFKAFLAVNTPSAKNASVLWETCKAYARGLIISYSASKNHQRQEKQKSLESELTDKEKLYITSPSPTLWEEITTLRSALNCLLTRHAEKKMKYIKQRFYEHGDKPGKCLAYYVKKRAESLTIAAVTDKDGHKVYENKLINDCFKRFYTELYTSNKAPEDERLMNKFFAQFELPILSEKQKTILNSPITKTELIKAIKSLQNGKSPGPDGFCCEFYKQFQDILVEPLLNMFNHSFISEEFPQTMKEANISVILKKGKCPESCSSYRPIALLNVDRKLLSKILASRLENYLPILIKEDQTGFIKGRNSSFNVRRLLNAIQAFKERSIEGLVLSLDAEKAFDRLEWSFLFYTLGKFGLGENFVKWVKIIYNDPQAAILTNGFRSTYFTTQRGVMQGCPLSPLLFALAIEPLAEAIRTTPTIFSLPLGQLCHKITLYADDVLIILSDPETSVPALIDVINRFSCFSGYKINLNKSEAMPLGTLSTIPAMTPPFPFKWSPNGFGYLGIFITPSFDQLYKANFVPLFCKIKEDLERWVSLPVSWLGRIALLKMNVLPRLLYPIQMIPILFSKRVLKDINGWLSSFIWNKRRPRLKMAVLHLPSSMGGLDMPNIKIYQLCAHLRFVNDWVKDKTSTWMDLETALSHRRLKDLLFFNNFKEILAYCSNPVTINTLKAWRLVRNLEGRSKITSMFTPIINNPEFLPGSSDPRFQQWTSKNIKSLFDLFSNNILMSFEQLCNTYSLTKQDFFRFLQVRHYIIHNTTLINHPELSDIEIMLFQQQNKMSLSSFYKVLVRLSTCDTQRVRSLWEKELSVTLDKETWDSVWSNTKNISICTRTRAIQVKIIHRLHISPHRRHLFDPSLSPLCLKCKTVVGTLTHCFWSCYKLQRYWSDIVCELTSVFSMNIELDPVYLILGIPSKHIKTVAGKRLFNILTFAARKNILLHWVSDKSPSVNGWRKIISELIPLEYLTSIIHTNMDQFYTVWRPYLNYIGPVLSSTLVKGFL